MILKVDNFNDSPLTLTVEKSLPKYYKIKTGHGVTINELGRITITIQPSDYLTVTLDFRPIVPGEVDDFVDIVSTSGNVFKVLLLFFGRIYKKLIDNEGL